MHTLYLVFEGGDGFLLNLDSFRFHSDKVRGDINQDGALSAADLVLMRKHLLAIEFLTAEQGPLADLSGDRSITAVDMALLKRALLRG